MQKYLICTILVLASLFITSCVEDESEPNAVETSYDKLVVTAGFAWLVPKSNEYGPDSTYIQEIKTKNISDYNFVLFAQGECSCTVNRKFIAEMSKVFQVCNIPSSKIRYFNMNSVTSIIPFENILKIKSLPSIFVFKGGVPFYSIMDTAVTQRYKAKDSLMLEEILLESLSK